jgi:hypothetical protein
MFAVKALFTADTPYWIMFAVLFLAGFMRSLQFTALNTLAYADVDSAEVAKANTFYTVAQQLFLALGVAVAAFLLDFRLWWTARSDLVAADFGFVLVVVSVVSAFAVFSYMRLQPGAGASISGRGNS